MDQLGKNIIIIIIVDLFRLECKILAKIRDLVCRSCVYLVFFSVDDVRLVWCGGVCMCVACT